MKLVRNAMLVCGLCLPVLAPAQSAAPFTTPTPTPAPYTAETTYAKLIGKYPFIRIAGSELPPSVRAVMDIT